MTKANMDAADPASQDTSNVYSNFPQGDDQAEELLLPSLHKLTAGLPKHELELIISEAKLCEEALQKEIGMLEAASGGGDDKGTSKQVNAMLDSEITPPDGHFTVSALLGRLRDALGTPLPPNSTLSAIRKKQTQPPPNKKKKVAERTLPVGSVAQQKQFFQMLQHEEYRRERDVPTLLALWKKMSTHRTSLVFRKPVNAKEAPGYEERIQFPIDLSLVRKMIVAKDVKSFRDLHTRVGMICHNCMKYNGRESDYGVVTREFEAMVDDYVGTALAAEIARAATAVDNVAVGSVVAGAMSITVPAQPTESRATTPIAPVTTPKAVTTTTTTTTAVTTNTTKAATEQPTTAKGKKSGK